MKTYCKKKCSIYISAYAAPGSDVKGVGILSDPKRSTK